MNLVLNMDVNATNRKLRDYQKANNIKVDKNLDDAAPKSAKKKAREDGIADPSGLIQGLKQIVAPSPMAEYDAFDGMSTGFDYFTIKDEYQELWINTEPSSATLAGGYNYRVSQVHVPLFS